jgi:uncharacterized protein (TIGR01244 family)
MKTASAIVLLLSSGLLLASCASVKNAKTVEAASPDPYPGVNTVGEDREVWGQLLRDHEKIRRVVLYRKDGVEATTESDDPAVAAKIIQHAKAMQARMKTGATVRVWDPVFKELFERHASVKLEVTPTEKGVSIVETSADTETVALLWSHASGVNDFVRLGPPANQRATRRIAFRDPPPNGEVAVGGERHRLIIGQPDEAMLRDLKAAGVTGVINFRVPTEHPEFAEASIVEASGMRYQSLPVAGAAGLTDDVIDAARASLHEACEAGGAMAIHCRSGNRASASWAAYRVLDENVPIEQAIAEARALKMSPEIEAKARDYIARKSAK